MWGFFVLQNHFIMSWFVYILQSEKDGDYYKGITENIELRLKQHNAGQSTYTSTKMPWQLLYRKKPLFEGFAFASRMFFAGFACNLNHL